MRLRVEFTTEPFDLDEAPAHAVVAREVVQGARLDAVDVGPFGNTVEGGADTVLATVDTLLRESLAAGATRVSLQVNVIGSGAGTAGAPGTGGGAASARGEGRCGCRAP
ncbi:hypothetical protein, partial [Streptomyces sp. NPDC059134]|uniref:hypothetical protein n=1 Tax=Streptomyces sp. NPDC059134 TaxID=3346738 RepID=UPI0036CA523C